MKCVRCDKNESSVVIENDDGTIEPVCEGCYLNATLHEQGDEDSKFEQAIKSYVLRIGNLEKEYHDMKLTIRCEKCDYWNPISDGNDDILYGKCQFNPPAALVYTAENFDPSQDMAIGYFPVTMNMCWCGKFKKEE